MKWLSTITEAENPKESASKKWNSMKTVILSRLVNSKPSRPIPLF